VSITPSGRQVRLRSEEVSVGARRIRLPAQADDRGRRSEGRHDRVTVSQADCAAGNPEAVGGQGTSPSRASEATELARVVGEGFPPVDEQLIALVLIEPGDVADKLSEVPGVSPVLGAALSPEVQTSSRGTGPRSRVTCTRSSATTCPAVGIGARLRASRSARAVRGLAVVGCSAYPAASAGARSNWGSTTNTSARTAGCSGIETPSSVSRARPRSLTLTLQDRLVLSVCG